MLPGYMIPSYYVWVEHIPLTSGGKVDHNALPLPKVDAGIDYSPPENRIQEKLIHIWADILNINLNESHIGINQDFFQLGGHSLKATVLASKIHKEFNVRIPLTEIFTSPTIKGLSLYINQWKTEKFKSIPPVEKRDYYPLSSAQRRLYILQQKVPRSTAYNIPQAISLSADTDISEVEQTFIRLIERHESLRTSFEMIAGQPIQRVHDHVEFAIEDLNLHSSGSHPGSLITRPFDLSKAPLMRVELIKTGENSQRLIVDIHHIISDGVSLEVLQRDFMSLSRGEVLTPLPIQYKDYVLWQNMENQKRMLKQQEIHWLEQFKGEIPQLNIPTDFSGVKRADFEGNTLIDEIPCDVSRLKAFSLKNGVTNFIFFLAVQNIFLSKISGQDDIVIGIPTAGRNHDDLHEVMGMFVNTLALRNRPGREKSFLQFLEEVKNNTLEAFNNQDYSFEDLVSAVAGKWEGHNPIFDVMFQVRETGSDDEDEDVSGIHLEEFQLRNTTAKFDLNFTIVIGNKMLLYIEYSTKLFKEKTIERFAGDFKDILFTVLENENVKLCDIQIKTVLSESKLKGFGTELHDIEF